MCTESVSAGRDNRKDRRFTTSGPASVAALQAPEYRWLGTMVDVSFNGFLVELRERPALSVGAKVQVVFGRLSTIGEVRHVTERGSGFAVGVRVEHVDLTTAGE